jgi:hypothetical protein
MKTLRNILYQPIPCIAFFLLFNALMMKIGTFSLVLSKPLDKGIYDFVILIGLLCNLLMIGMAAFYHLLIDIKTTPLYRSKR